MNAMSRDACDREHRRLGLQGADRRPGVGRHLSRGTIPRSSSSRRRPAGMTRDWLLPMPTRRPRRLIRDLLAEVVRGRDAMAVPGCLVGDGRGDPQPRPARDRLDGDLGRRRGALGPEGPACSDLPLVTLLGAVRDTAPVYGSGGFTSYSIEQLQEQLGGWVAAGIPRVKMKIGTPPGRRPRPGPGRPRGDRARGRAVRRRQRRLQPQAGPGPGRAVRRAGSELVRGAGLLRRPRRPAPAPRPRAGRHGHRRRRVRLRPVLLPPDARSRRRGRAPGRRDAAAAGSPGSCGSGPSARRTACRSRPTVRRRCTPTRPAPCRTSATWSTSTTTTGSSTCSSTVRSTPVGGRTAARPLPPRPGPRLQAPGRRPIRRLSTRADERMNRR